VIDVSNPAIPQIIGSVDTPGIAYSVTVVEERAYIADGSSGLQVIDVGNPTTPQIIGSVDTPGYALGITVVDDRAYIADDFSGLQVIDVGNNPATWRIIGSVDTPGSANDVMVVDDRAYIADNFYGLQVIDVSNPATPQIIGSVDTPGYARGITVVDDTAYIANSDGLQVIDVSDPTNPQEIGFMDTPSYASSVTVVDDTAYVTSGNGLMITTVPVQIDPTTVNGETEISLTLPNPVFTGHYTLRVFNNTESDELKGAVSFTADARMLESKAIIVAGGGPNAPGDIWEAIQQSANGAYNVLIHEGFDHSNIRYLTDEYDNAFRDGSSTHDELKYAINTWAQDASKLIIFFVDHGLRDYFIIRSDGDSTQQLGVHELDGWLDSLQQTLIGPVTFIYDACYSGTFATKLSPPEGKDRIVVTGASDEPAYFLKIAEDDFDTFSLHFWHQIGSRQGNIGYAFSAAAEKMKGYNQTALINADGNSFTNEEEDFSIANTMTIRRAKQIFLKPLPTIGDVVGEITIDGDSTATIWVGHVRNAERVRASIMPPHIEPGEDGGPITDLVSIELSDSDNDGTYEGTYDGFTMQGSYLVMIEAWTTQEIYNYVQDAMIDQVIASLPVYTAVTQMSGTQDITADRYEEDNSYHQAHVITMDDPNAQPHHFHDPGDADWVKFFGLSGQTYTISAENPSKICDAVIELFASDGTSLLGVSDNSGGAGDDKLLNWTCPQDGIYYVKISSANSHFGENVTYYLKIYRPIGPSLSALISGRVLSPDLAPLSDVRIFTDSGGSAISDKKGSFFMRSQAGKCTLTLESDQYGITTLQIDVIEGQDNHYEVIFGDGQPDQSSGGGGGGGGGCFIRVPTTKTH
jgi:hypothetical protein